MITPKLTGKVTGGDATIKRIQSLSESIRRELRVTVDRLGTSLLEGAKRIAVQKLNKAPKGNLVGAINKLTTESGNAIVSTVGVSLAQIPYARIHEFGGVITAKNVPYLRFKTADGAWHTVTSVTMPERSYLRSALAQLAPTIETQIRLALKRAANRSGVAT